MKYRETLIRIVTFLGGLYFFLEFVLPETMGNFSFADYSDQITTGFTAVGVMAVGLGLINLLGYHGSKIAFKRIGWVHSSALLLSMIAMLGITTIDWIKSDKIAERADRFYNLRDFALVIPQDIEKQAAVPEPALRTKALVDASISAITTLEAETTGLTEVTHDPIAAARESGLRRDLATELVGAKGLLNAAPAQTPFAYQSLGDHLGKIGSLWREILSIHYDGSTIRQVYTLLYDGLFTALGSAMFSLLGFYIAAAAYRAFRVRSVESGLMMGAALLVMLGQIPFGIWIWEGFPDVRLWILEIPNAAAFRAIRIGAAIAGLILAFRMWLSIESGSFTKGGKRQ